ncbi:Os08g0198900 [Oryza sativa Japonica Group]|uniref:Os08g0198900 protein n=1 Tax=Oryza sativa subsp. japonica TaxID=39947 RepID=A0A0P0XCQ2_ORYSJ|nr:hypothetical protein EE612_042645 [Oryza sativa]BAT04241.1 Os08g0198900 [Oryza sativa Japonica Group]
MATPPPPRTGDRNGDASPCWKYLFLPLDRVQVSIFQAPVPTWLAGSISDSIQTGRKTRVKVRRFAVGGHGALSPIAPNLATHLVTCI